jgi:hypothetical protein
MGNFFGGSDSDTTHELVALLVWVRIDHGVKYKCANQLLDGVSLSRRKGINLVWC